MRLCSFSREQGDERHSHDGLTRKCTRNAGLSQIVREYRQTSGFGERGPGYFGIDELVYVHAVVARRTLDNTAKHGSAVERSEKQRIGFGTSPRSMASTKE